MIPYQLLTHILLLLIPCFLLLSATPSPSPDPYPAVVSLPARHASGQQSVLKPPPPDTSHDLLPYVIISTIDGALHAVERDGGKIKWSLRDGVSPLVGGEVRGKGEDEYIVEPLSGSLYVFEGEDAQSVRKLPLSVEQLIELSPFTFPHSPSRIFTGSKHTSLITIDLRTGQQLDCFSALTDNATESCVCENEQLLDDLEGRSRTNSDILFVGRTDYRLIIHSPPSNSIYSASPSASDSTTGERRSGLQEISYSTYTPNSFDRSLAEFWSKANQHTLEEDGIEINPTRVELGHDGVAVGVESGAGYKWLTDLGSIGIAVYDILLPLTPAEAKPIIVPQPPVRLESLFPLPDQPEQRHFDILAKSPSTYIGSVPYQLTLPASESDETRPPPPRRGDKPLLYALSSSSYPLINFAPPARPGAQANGSFPLSADLPERDQLLPYLLDPAEDEKTIDPAPNDYLKDMQRGARAGRSWIFWTIGVLAALIMVAAGIFGLGRRKNIKQTATPPSEKEPLLVRNDPQPTYTEDNQTPQVPDKLESEIVDKDKEIKPKKKNARRRVRGKKKRDDDDGDDKSSNGSPSVRGEKPLPDLPRAISTVALQDENDKERLVISKDPIGYGSHGTIVLKGTWGGRPVAVKRLLSDFTRLASQEVKLLQASDDHPNVIRYYCQEKRDNFLYIALDLCEASLADLIEAPAQHKELVSSLDHKKALMQVTAGVKHLHDMNIIHRDIKPQNVLVARGKDGGLKMVVSDFGLARRLDQNQSSFAPTANNLAGSLGWRAPECIQGQVRLNEGFERDSTMSSSSSFGSLLDMEEGEDRETRKNQARLTKAVDLFALGCLYFWVLTSGTHPFGETYDRESHIVKGDMVNIKMLEVLGEEGVEARDLITGLLSMDPALRPRTAACIAHPFFWNPEKRLRFLCDASDRFEIMTSNPPEATLVALENNATNVVGKDWCSQLDRSISTSLKQYRKYKGNSVRDLLRAMRNKKHHYQDLDPAAKRNIGALPAGFLHYFTSRHPHLFLHVYEVVKGSYLEQESMFQAYFSAPDV